MAVPRWKDLQSKGRTSDAFICQWQGGEIIVHESGPVHGKLPLPDLYNPLQFPYQEMETSNQNEWAMDVVNNDADKGKTNSPLNGIEG